MIARTEDSVSVKGQRVTGTAGTANHSIKDYNGADPFMPPKLVALIVAAALTTGWLLASILSPPVAELQALPERVEPSVPTQDARTETPFTEQLHLRLQSVPAAPVPRRNPFVFGTATPRLARETAPASDATTTADAERLAVPTGPSLRLAGIGSTATAGEPLRTAVVSDGTTVHLVKVGERVTGYAVVAITDDAVTIEDATGQQWVLRLK